MSTQAENPLTEARPALAAGELRLLLDSTREAIFGIGLDGRCTFCNPAAIRMLGWHSEDDLLGREIHSLTHYLKPDGSPYPPDECPISRVIRSGEAVSADDELFFRADRSGFPVRYSAHPIVRDGAIVGAVLNFFDLSASRRSEGELRTLIQTSIDGFWISDFSGAFLDANSALCRMLGYSRDELLGMRVADIEAVSPPSGKASNILELFLSGSTHFQTRHRRQDGQLIDVEINSRYVAALGQRFFVFVRDISASKRLEASLRESAETHRSILSTTLDGFLLLDDDGRVLDANPSYARQSGYSRTDLLGMRLADLELAEDDSAVGAHLRRIIAAGSDLFESRHRRSDGSAWDVEISVSYRHGRFFSFLRDISERKLIENTQTFLARCGYLNPGENFFTQLARYLAQALAMDYVCIDSLEGDGLRARTEAIYFDGAFEDNVSYALQDTPCGEVVGQSICCFATAVRHRFPRDEVLQQMLAESYIGCTLWGFDGTPVGLIAIIGRQPLVNPRLAESLLKLVAVRAAGELERQRGEQRLHNQQLQLEKLVRQRTAQLSEALDAARLADRAKDQFLANVSHELRTPLSAVIGLSALARRLSTDPLQQDYLDKVGNAGTSLSHLINDLLDPTKIVAGRLEFENTTFSLRDMFARSNSVIAHQAREKGLEFVERIDDEVPDLLVGDPLRIEQILLNLLGNAIKFTSAGHVGVRIGLAAREAARVCLAIEVEDSGLGLDEEEIEQLFKPFAQADASMTRRYGGTGLGLAICKRLAGMMDGGISASSRLGVGSTFRVTLRLALGRTEDLLPAPVDSGRLPASYRQARVLVVEDQPLNREIAEALLAEVGITPVMAGNGREALDLLGESGPRAFDLVLMDIQMPVMDGLAATRELRRRTAFDTLPIIAMTAHTMEHEKRISAAAGMNDFIGKPFDPPTFYRTLAKWIPRRKHLLAGGERASFPARLSASDRSAAGGDWAAQAGIDSAAGLSRFADDEARYRLWLNDFASQGPATVSQIREAFAAEDKGPAGALAHALAGRVGMLGMGELHALARRLEESARPGAGTEARAAAESGLRPGEDLAESLDRLEQAILEVAGQIAAALGGGAEGARTLAMAPLAMRPPAAPPPAGLMALLHLLETADGGSAQAIEDCLDELGDGPWTPLLRAALAQVRGFDFDAARRLLADGQTTTLPERS